MALRDNVTYGRNFRVGRGAIIGAPHKLVIEDDVAVGINSVIQVNGVIRKHALIGANVQIVGRNDHAIDEVGTPIANSTWVAEREPEEKDAVTIGTDVWIGASSVILSGVTIGAGAVIGAGSLVTKDVPPFTIVGGNPARELGKRFDDRGTEAEHLSKISVSNEPRTSRTTTR